MARPKVDEMERVKRYLATAPEGFLYVVKGWCDLLILSKRGIVEPAPAKRARKKADGQLPLAGGTGA
jgi:hypothetical protein